MYPLAAYTLQDEGDFNCPAGLEIESIAECQKAFDSLKAQNSFSGVSVVSTNRNDVASACTVHTTGDGAPYYNSNADPTGPQAKFKKICKKGGNNYTVTSVPFLSKPVSKMAGEVDK